MACRRSKHPFGLVDSIGQEGEIVSPAGVDEMAAARFDNARGLFAREITARRRCILDTEAAAPEELAVDDASAILENIYRGQSSIGARRIEVEPGRRQHEREAPAR